MLKAVFCDFYGTVVFEDDEPISIILEKIFQSGNAESKKEIGAFWWQRFSTLCKNSFGNTFRTQRELEIQSLAETLERFGVEDDAVRLSEPQFSYWKEPPIFADSKAFFAKCPVPIYIVSNIDTADLISALNFHELKPESVVTSEKARAYKPRSEIFLYALQKFELKPHEVIHICDSITSDVMGSNAASIRSIWLNRKNKQASSEVNMQASDLHEALKILVQVKKIRINLV